MDCINKSDLWTASKLFLAVVFFTWQSIACIVGFFIYLVLVQVTKNYRWTIPIAYLLVLAAAALYLQNFYHINIFGKFFVNSFIVNEDFWYLLKSASIRSELFALFSKNYDLLLSVSLLMAGIFGLIDAIIISSGRKHKLVRQ